MSLNGEKLQINEKSLLMFICAVLSYEKEFIDQITTIKRKVMIDQSFWEMNKIKIAFSGLRDNRIAKIYNMKWKSFKNLQRAWDLEPIYSATNRSKITESDVPIFDRLIKKGKQDEENRWLMATEKEKSVL